MRDQGITASSEQMMVGGWPEAAVKVLKERYLLKNAAGEVVETPDEMCRRVADALAEAERVWGADEARVREVADQFYSLMASRRFLPNSPTLMNAGKNNGLQWSACYTIPVPDNLEGIFDAIKHAAIIHKSGGGTGFGFGGLRPKGAKVHTTSGMASGPVSFLKVFNAATAEIVQGGTRRGANMATMPVSHPDADEFIHCKDFKEDGSRDITNFNISLLASDAFMEAVQEGREFEVIDPQTGAVLERRDARQMFQAICEAAWRTGDPGLLFVDKANNSGSNPIPDLETLNTTNPCGEVWLGPYDACNLGSLNLGEFVGYDLQGKGSVNWPKLAYSVEVAVRFLDNVVELNPFPLPQVTEKVRSLRRLGLGVMGWADLLFRLRIPYHSDEARTLAREVMAAIAEGAEQATEGLAKERGVFPLFEQSRYRGGRPRRNAQLTVIAPTGSISIIAGCSSGIEPVFALAYQHRVKLPDGERVLTLVNETFRQIAEEEGFWSPALEEYIGKYGGLAGFNDEQRVQLNTTGTPQPLMVAPRVPEWAQAVFITARETPIRDHVLMQAAWQAHVENAVSKSINLPHAATVQDIWDAYMLAYDLGCKGITVFRDGCLPTGQVLNVGVAEAAPRGPIRAPSVLKRPGVLPAKVVRVKAPEGTLYLTLAMGEEGPFETFLSVGKAGSDIDALAEALGRLISLVLRLPSELSAWERLTLVRQQLEFIGGSRSVGFGPNRVHSLPDAIAKGLAMIEGGEAPDEVFYSPAGGAEAPPAGELCPDCGNATLAREEGCKKCVCGYSEC